MRVPRALVYEYVSCMLPLRVIFEGQANHSLQRSAWGKPQVLGTARAANETEKAMKRIRVKMLLLFD